MPTSRDSLRVGLQLIRAPFLPFLQLVLLLTFYLLLSLPSLLS